MRAAGLLPLLLSLLLLGVSSQDDADPGQTTTTAATETTTMTTPASTTDTSPTTPAPSPTTAQPTSTTPVVVHTTVATTAQSTITTTTTDPGTSSSPAAASPTTVTGTTPPVSGTTLADTTTTSTHASGQDSSSHGATTLTTITAASFTTSQQPSSATASLGPLGTTTAANADAISPPGAVGAAATSSPSTQPQGKQPLDHLPNTTVSATVPRTDPSQSSKDCAVSPPPCATKQPPSSSTSPVQGPSPSTSPGSPSTSVTSPIASPSLTTTPTLQPGSKDTVPEAPTRTPPGADQSTHDAGSTSAKPTSASQSPASTQTPAPAPREPTDSYSPGHQHPNISFPNELICKDQVQHTGPTIYLREPRTCAGWKAASNNISLFESFCSTAQHVFDASRDRCTVTLTACEPQSHCWTVWVVLHLPLDSEEVFKGLKEKKERLEEFGIVNVTSDKMVEDMTINDEFSTPLIITIITLAGSLLLIAAIYGCHQRFSQKKDQNIHPDVPGFDDGHVALIFNQRLTEEMQTMENGYHDNPTLEVMETSSEMQEKKVNLNGELGDSWIVPLDTLMKEDLEEEEDTHL